MLQHLSYQHLSYQFSIEALLDLRSHFASLVHPRTGHEGLEGNKRYSSTLSLTSALDGFCVNTTPRPLFTQERPGTHCVRGRGVFRPRQTRQLPRAVDLKGWLLSCQSY